MGRVDAAIAEIAVASRELFPVVIVGAPLRRGGYLFNCAVVVYRGTILGVVPKSYLPNYREFYEKRQFTSGRDAISHEVDFLGGRDRRERGRKDRSHKPKFDTHLAILRV